MANNKIEITGLRKRWLVSSLSPIFVVALLIRSEERRVGKEC